MMKGNSYNSHTAVVIERMPRDSVGVEIGVWKGDSSELFLERTSHLHLVDPWSVDAYRQSDEHGGFASYLKEYSELVGASHEGAFQEYYDLVYAGVVRRFKDKPVTIHRCTSAEFFDEMTFAPAWFYIDGSHSFNGCLADLFAAGKRATYAIFGDDYGSKQGVTRAVDAYILDTGFKFDRLGHGQYQITIR